MLRKISFFLFIGLVSFLQAQPRIGGVVNGASFALAPLPNGAIARGSIFTVFTSAAGPATIARASSLPLPTQVGGTSIRVTSGGQNRDAIMLFSTAGQLAAILPSDTPEGNATMTVTYNGQTSAPFNFRVVGASFGAFAQNQAGSGPAVAFNFLAAGNEPLNILQRPATPNQVVTLYGTGLGPITGSDAVPSAQRINTPVEVWVGGRQATVDYAGRSSCCAGLDQVNFRVPQGVEGCYVPVYVVVGGVLSNFTTISVASSTGAACTSPKGLGGDAGAGGTVRWGDITFLRTSFDFMGTALTTEFGSASFIRGPGELAGLNFDVNSVATGSCYVYSSSDETPDEYRSPALTYLNAGTLRVNNAQRGERTFTFQNGTYSVQLSNSLPIPGAPPSPPYLEAGSYTVSASGGPDVGAFSQTFTTRGPINWTNPVSTVNRRNPLTVNWSNGEPGGFTIISGFSFGTLNGAEVGTGFTCIERAERGTFTVPASIMGVLIPSTGDDDLSTLSVGGYSATVRLNPVPSGLDGGAINVLALTGRQVQVQ